jgi:glycerophosphoryl diester phosphodiesterase
VSNTSWQIIRQLDAGSWFSPAFAGEKVPLLEDYVKTAAELGLGMNIEMKGNVFTAGLLAEHVVSVLAQHWNKHLPKPLITSFSKSCLKAVYKRTPELALGWISSKWWRNMSHKLDQLHCISLSADEKILTRERVQELRDHGKHVLAYTVDDAHRARELLDFGVDGIFSNNPQLLG